MVQPQHNDDIDRRHRKACQIVDENNNNDEHFDRLIVSIVWIPY